MFAQFGPTPIEFAHFSDPRRTWPNWCRSRWTWVDFGPNVRKFGTSHAKTGQCGQESTRGGRVRPMLGRIRPNSTPDRPDSARIRPDSTNRCAESTRFGPISAKLGLRPNFVRNRPKSAEWPLIVRAWRRFRRNCPEFGQICPILTSIGQTGLVNFGPSSAEVGPNSEVER